MPALTIALMGFLAFAGGPVAVADAAPALTAEAAATTTLAVADAPVLIRPAADETYTVKLTSYNAVPEQTDANPNDTASGLVSNPEVIAARSVDLAAALPFGTVVAIEREATDTASCRFDAVEHLIGYRVIGDSMHSRKRMQVDVLLDPTDTVSVAGKATNPSIALGMCNGVTVRVVGRLKLSEVPSTQEELRQIVEGDSLAMAN